MNTFKTTALLTGLTIVFIVFGNVIGGIFGIGRTTGMIVALIAAAGMNFGMYWYSDKIILSQYDAEKISQTEAPRIHEVVQRLAEKAGIPTPAIYRIPDSNPNAFATGRNPDNAVIAVTDGILDALTDDGLEGVLAHELSHVLNRDTLISSITATLAGAISLLSFVARIGVFFGGRGRDSNIFVVLATAILAPIVATVIQMAISRSREYKADRSGAKLCGKPMSLARALKKLHQASTRQPMQKGSKQTAHLFIVNPFSFEGLQSLFSTHPSVDDRVQNLQEMASNST